MFGASGIAFEITVKAVIVLWLALDVSLISAFMKYLKKNKSQLINMYDERHCMLHDEDLFGASATYKFCFTWPAKIFIFR